MDEIDIFIPDNLLIQPIIMKILLIAATIVSFSLASCNRHPKETPSNTEILKDLGKAPGINAGDGSYSIIPPPGWSSMDTSMNGVRFKILKAPPGSATLITPSMNILTTKVGGASLDDYFAAAHGGMKGMLKNYEEIGSGKKKINDLPARWLQYRCTAASGSKMEAIFTLIVADDIGYAITMATQEGDMMKWEKVFENTLNSFSLGGATLVKPDDPAGQH
jgi:hypothetical protein